jgi:hypothetical protein
LLSSVDRYVFHCAWSGKLVNAARRSVEQSKRNRFICVTPHDVMESGVYVEAAYAWTGTGFSSLLMNKRRCLRQAIELFSIGKSDRNVKSSSQHLFLFVKKIA